MPTRVFVGVPSLSNSSKDRYYSYLQTCKAHVEAALGAMEDVSHIFYVSDPTTKLELAGLVDCDNEIVSEFLKSGCSLLWLVELDVEVPKDSFRKLLSLLQPDCDIACGYVRRHNGDGLILSGSSTVKSESGTCLKTLFAATC